MFVHGVGACLQQWTAAKRCLQVQLVSLQRRAGGRAQQQSHRSRQTSADVRFRSKTPRTYVHLSVLLPAFPLLRVPAKPSFSNGNCVRTICLLRSNQAPQTSGLDARDEHTPGVWFVNLRTPHRTMIARLNSTGPNRKNRTKM